MNYSQVNMVRFSRFEPEEAGHVQFNSLQTGWVIWALFNVLHLPLLRFQWPLSWPRAWQTAEPATVFTSSANHGSATRAVANQRWRAPAAETAGRDRQIGLWSAGLCVSFGSWVTGWLWYSIGLQQTVSSIAGPGLVVHRRSLVGTATRITWWGCCCRPATRWMPVITSFLRPSYKGSLMLLLLLQVIARLVSFRSLFAYVILAQTSFVR